MWGHWYLCFGILMTSPLCFKTRVGSFICAWWRRTCYTLNLVYIRWDWWATKVIIHSLIFLFLIKHFTNVWNYSKHHKATKFTCLEHFVIKKQYQTEIVRIFEHWNYFTGSLLSDRTSTIVSNNLKLSFFWAPCSTYF